MGQLDPAVDLQFIINNRVYSALTAKCKRAASFMPALDEPCLPSRQTSPTCSQHSLPIFFRSVPPPSPPGSWSGG